jgi:hypothetical protein
MGLRRSVAEADASLSQYVSEGQPVSDSETSRIESKLDILIKLMALNVSPDTLSLAERAGRLSRAGLTPKEIAALCETTPNTVSVALSKARSKKK